MINILLKTKSANSIVEYSLLLVVAIFAFVSMQAYLKRNFQGGLRARIDQMGQQFSYEHGNTSDRTIMQIQYNSTLSGGDSEENYKQYILRTTHEAIEGENAETKRIGF